MKFKSMLMAALFSVAVFATLDTEAADGQVTFITVDFGNLSKGQALFNGQGVQSSFLGQIYISSSLNGSYTAIGSALPFLDSDGAGFISGPTYTASGFSIGQSVFYQIRAWNSAAGSTFEQAAASASGIIGISQSTQIVLGGTAGDPPVLTPIPQVNLHNSFNLAAVPEPTTVALAVMGGLGLLARRRRNQA